MCSRGFSGVDAKMLFGGGECLGDGVQHGGRANSGQGFGTFLIEQIAAILKEFGNEQVESWIPGGLARPIARPVAPATSWDDGCSHPRLTASQSRTFGFAFLAVASKGLYDPVGIAQVDFVGVLLVLALLAKLLQLLPAGGLIPGEHSQPVGEGVTQVGKEMAGLQNGGFSGQKQGGIGVHQDHRQVVGVVLVFVASIRRSVRR